MNMLKKYGLVTSTLAAMIILGAAGMPYQQDEKPKNLKVLPKDISHEALDKVMDEYTEALGVKCNYCHASSKDDIKKLDFASDEKKAKDVARDMMKMTSEINRLFFKNTGTDAPSVSCITCHNGQEYPPFKK